MSALPKLMVLGYARHGKDTVCDILRDRYGFRFISSSLFCADRVVYPVLQSKYGYATIEDCYEDRGNHRAEWFDLIAAYNNEDPSRLVREILTEYDIYCGLRNKRELVDAREKKLFDAAIWVDASERVPPEDESSCTVQSSLADLYIDNNRPLEELKGTVESLMSLHFRLS